MLVAEIKDDKGNLLGTLAVMPKDFKTGSRGYFAMGKMPGLKEGERLQVQVQAVIIGSKPADVKLKAGPVQAPSETKGS
jgi:hypothetical protein